ncbi:MAG: hypothetical protein AAF998_00265 [Bacteroidota bacterium]
MEVSYQYHITDEHLHLLEDQIRVFLAKKGIEIVVADLSGCVEEEIHLGIPSEDRHHETAISNGKQLYIHDEMEEMGLVGRIYDLLHMGAGHMWQWGSDERSGLNHFGDEAWAIGGKYFLFAEPEQLALVASYEKEAGQICLYHLALILGKIPELAATEKDNIYRFYNDFLQTDIAYIIDYYQTGEVRHFLDGWIYCAPAIRPITASFPVSMHKRENHCVALIMK